MTYCWKKYNGMKADLPNLVLEKYWIKGENFKLIHRVVIMRLKAWLRGTHLSIRNLQT